MKVRMYANKIFSDIIRYQLIFNVNIIQIIVWYLNINKKCCDLSYFYADI